MSNSKNTALKVVTAPPKTHKSEYQVFCDQHASGSIKGKFRIARKEDKKIVLSSSHDLKSLTGGTFVKYGDKNMNIAQAWGLDPNRNMFNNGVAFNPIFNVMQSDELLINNGVLNLFCGITMPATKGDCNLITKHILDVWCDGNQIAFVYVMNWLARMIQMPEKTGAVAIILRSKEGAGKDTITQMLVDYFGEHGVMISRGERLTHRFNGQLGTAVFVCSNEAVWGGNKQEEGALKSLITDKVQVIEYKGLESFTTNNCVHLILNTNTDWSAPMGLDDRRYVALDVSEKRIGDTKYFDALYKQIENGGKEAFIYELMNRDIAGFKPQEKPKIKSQTSFDNKLQTAPTVVRWMAECIDMGQITYKGEFGQDSTLLYTGVNTTTQYAQNECDWNKKATVSKSNLFTAYGYWCNKKRLHAVTSNVFGKELLNRFGVKQTRIKTKGHREQKYKFKPYKVMKKELEDLLM